jgi:hypothetical protein
MIRIQKSESNIEGSAFVPNSDFWIPDSLLGVRHELERNSIYLLHDPGPLVLV